MNYSKELKAYQRDILIEIRGFLQNQIDSLQGEMARIDSSLLFLESEPVENDEGDVISYADYIYSESRP